MIAAEIRQRRRTEPGLSPEEYRRRFPGRAVDLTSLAGPPAPVHPAATRYPDAPFATRYTDDPLRTRYSDRPTDPPTSAAPATTSAVPGYEVLGELGRGGMGVVYKARQQALDRIVALKMILAGAHAGPEELARFRSEAEAVARLQHPNIVQIYEVGEHDGRPFFSLEFVEGGSLDRKLAGTPQPPREAAALVETLARAIHAAHQRGVVHRDLKPANVLLTADGTPKITDFGLAKRLGRRPGQTQTGAVMGTPSYMAPEQAAGKTQGGRAGRGRLRAGRDPLRAADRPAAVPGGDTRWTRCTRCCTRSRSPPRQLQPKTPRDLETICLKCLQKEPAPRYATRRALADDLRRFLDGRAGRGASGGATGAGRQVVVQPGDRRRGESHSPGVPGSGRRIHVFPFLEGGFGRRRRQGRRGEEKGG